MEKEIVERKLRGLESQEQDMQYFLEKIRYQVTPRGLNFCYESLANCHRKQGIFDYFIEGDITSFKQNLYVASRLDLAAINFYDHQRFSTGQEILYALLSGNLTLIDELSRLEPADYVGGRGNPLCPQFVVHMYQLAIQGDYEKLQTKIEKLAKNGRKNERQLPAIGKDFFSLLMQGDKSELEDLIAEHAKVKSQDVLTEDFMCFQGTIEAKICWLKGIQVQVDSPLLPMALMPIAPLDHYDDVYDFLQPGYVPPKVGWLERMRYRFRERAQAKELTKRLIKSSRKF